MKTGFLLLALLIASGIGWAGDADIARKAGMDASKLGAIHTRFQKFVDDQQIAGAVTLVSRRGEIVHFDAVGSIDIEAKKPMKRDSIFQIASMTKPITAIGIMMLEEEGKLSVDDPVEKHLPEFRGQMLIQKREGGTVTLTKPARPITLRDLLTHTSGLAGPPSGMADLYRKRDRTLAEAVIAFSQRPLDFEPGLRWSYCNTGIDTLGRVIEVVSGKSYEDFLNERLFRPLGSKDTFFYPQKSDLSRIATLYKQEKGKLARSDNFLGNAIGGKYPLPAGGLFSTANDLAKIYQMMLNRGDWKGKQLLSVASVEKMTKLQSGEIKTGFVDGMGWGFGWAVVREPKGVTEMLSPGTYGHGGAFGTQAWIDPKKEMFFILLVQRSNIPNSDASDMRRELQALAVAAITE